MHGENVDAALLEDAAAHHRHDAAAAFAPVFGWPAPGLALEAARRHIPVHPGIVILDLFEGRADAIAKFCKPLGGALAARFAHGGNPFVCFNASPNTMAAAKATLIERNPCRIGIVRRANAASSTSGGTPVLSRPRSRVSPPAKAKPV